nr:aldolase/citrate lyase family protein [uncultured Schaedlerella sp.]
MKSSNVHAFKERMNAACVIGIFMKTCDGSFIESSGKSGIDFCILDMEHGPVSYEHLPNLIRACECSGALPIVRVADNTEEYIGKALDLGAMGVQIPQVNDRASASAAVRHAKFYPDGSRGVCRYVRAADYSSQNKYEYFHEANEAMVIVQVEGLKGVENLSDILSVPGIDVIFIGPYDLSQSLGVPGNVHSSEVVGQMKLIVEKAAASNIAVGTFVDTPEDALYWKDLGVKYIANSVDVGIFYTACKDIVTSIRSR